MAPAIASLVAVSATAGMLTEPVVETIEEPPAKSSLAGWIVPLLAIAVVGAIIASNGDDDEAEPEISTSAFPTVQ